MYITELLYAAHFAARCACSETISIICAVDDSGLDNERQSITVSPRVHIQSLRLQIVITQYCSRTQVCYHHLGQTSLAFHKNSIDTHARQGGINLLPQQNERVCNVKF